MTATNRPADHQTVAKALGIASRRLQEAGIETPRLDAEVLLRDVLGLDRTALFLRLMDPLSPDDLDRFTAQIARRLTGEPIAYLTGVREFMGLPFAVRSGVLIPRPETEILVEWALAWLQTRSSRPSPTIVDVGTGSGAIVLSLADHLGPTFSGILVGSDVAEDALAVAVDNRDRLGLDDRVQLVRGDLIAWCGGPVDLLLANLPYLRPEQVAANPDLAAEPRLALIGGVDGLRLVHRLVADTPRVLHPAGALALEIDPSQREPAVALITATLPTATVTVLPDLTGRPRHLVAVRPSRGSRVEA